MLTLSVGLSALVKQYYDTLKKKHPSRITNKPYRSEEEKRREGCPTLFPFDLKTFNLKEVAIINFQTFVHR